MGIRETLNKNPAITTWVTAGIVVLAIGAIIWQLWGGSPFAGSGTSKIFFSDDDGNSYFADDSTKIPPFDHNGKQAVKAMVFKCGDSGKPFVAFLQRYTSSAKQKLEEAAKKPGTLITEDLDMVGLEVKKPKTGDKGWVKQTDPHSAAVTQVKCPDGTTNGLQPVYP